MIEFEVDIEKTDFGVVRVKAKTPQEAMEIVKQNQYEPEEDQLFTGSEIRPISAREAYS